MALDILTVANASAAITASRSVTVTFPAYVAALDDLIIIFPSTTTAATTPTAPSGWVNALGGTVDVETTAAEICAFYHLVTAGEVGTSTFTATNLYGASVTGDVVAIVLQGVDTAAVIDTSGTTFNSTATTPHVLASIAAASLTNGSAIISSVMKEGTGAYTAAPALWSLVSTSNVNQGRALLRRSIGGNSSNQAIAATNITPSASSRYASISLAIGAVATGFMGTSVNTGTFSYTVGPSDTILIVGVAVGATGTGNLVASWTTRTVTYNGVPMISAGAVDTNNTTSGFVELFYLFNPAVGANTVSVNMTKTAVTDVSLVAGAVSYPRIGSVGAAVTAFGSSATPLVTVPSKPGETVVAAICTGGLTGGASDTLRFIGNRSTGSGAGCLLIQDQAGESSAALSSVIAASDFWGAVGLALKPTLIAKNLLSTAVVRAGFY